MADSLDDRLDRTGESGHLDPLQLVRDALGDLRFGGIQLTVHEGKLVQIEVTEKHRFT